ncbi:hypothetical protein M9Y10_033234 [Tritrichomonas musculus]|uniref:Surface antigen BspA-like n=1 Tax=Tritrichomonas musculus TaxID=1915356 RepID=A0ABR2GYG8_9EUKA
MLKDQTSKKIIKDEIIYLINQNIETASVIGVSYVENDIYIPRSIRYESKEYVVTSVSNGAFTTQLGIKSIKFAQDSEIRTIESHAFANSKVQQLYFPASVTDLKEGWCRYTFELKRVEIDPRNPRYSVLDGKFVIGKSDIKNDGYDILVFAVRDITEALIPSYIKVIGPHAFHFCTKLRNLEFPSNSELQIICKEAFASSVEIHSLIIPAHVKHICEGAFSFSCLKSIEFLSNSELQTIDKKAFQITSIKEITIPDSVTTIGEEAFYNIQSQLKINISPNSKLRTIGKNAFLFDAINEIFFPPNLVELVDGWCHDTKNLTKITIDPRNPRYLCLDKKYIIGKSSESSEDYDVLVFAVRDIVEAIIPSFIKKIGPFAFNNCDKLVRIEIPSEPKLETIDEYAFISSSIESFSIPASLIDLKEGWYQFSRNLTKVEVDPRNPRYSCIDGKMIVGKSEESKEDYDVLVFAARDIVEAIIPSSIEVICSYSFQYCSKLERVEIPPDSKLRVIGKYAFYETSIESISIPSHVTQIGACAFSYCKKLKTVEIPPNSGLKIIDKEIFYFSTIENFSIPIHVTQIGTGAFSRCNKLKRVDFQPNSELQIIEKEAFLNSSIENIKIPSHVKTICESCFARCFKLKQLEIPADSELRTIEKNAFHDSAIKELFIPASLVNLEKEWPYYTNKLTKVEVDPRNPRYSCIDGKMIVGKSEESKEDYDVLVFAARDIVEAIIPSSIEVICSYSFQYCSKLERVEIPPDSKLRVIDFWSFIDSSIRSIQIPDHVVRIGKNAFRNNKELTRIEISQNSELQSFGDLCFNGSSINSIFVPSQISEISFYECQQLQIIEIDENSHIQTIHMDCMGSCVFMMIPVQKIHELTFIHEDYPLNDEYY